MDEGAVVVVVVVVEHARHNSHDIIHSKTTLAAFSRFPLDRRCHHAFGEKEKEREKSSKKSSLFCGVSHSSKALSRFKKKEELIQLLLLAGADERATATRPNQRRSFATTLFLSANSSRKRTSLFCRRRRRATFLSSADVFFSALGKKFPPRAHTTTTKEQRKRETSHEEKTNKQSSSQSSETDATRPRATYHERNRFRRFCLHRGIDGFLHSFGEVVRFDVLLDRHISSYFTVIALFFVTTLPRGFLLPSVFFSSSFGKKMNKKFLFFVIKKQSKITSLSRQKKEQRVSLVSFSRSLSLSLPFWKKRRRRRRRRRGFFDWVSTRWRR